MRTNEKGHLAQELEDMLNRVSAENGSDTPDFVLAEYLLNCLLVFDIAVNRREKWYGRRDQDAPPPVKAEEER